jgi:hypothetical protein
MSNLDNLGKELKLDVENKNIAKTLLIYEQFILHGLCMVKD